MKNKKTFVSISFSVVTGWILFLAIISVGIFLIFHTKEIEYIIVASLVIFFSVFGIMTGVSKIYFLNDYFIVPKEIINKRFIAQKRVELKYSEIKKYTFDFDSYGGVNRPNILIIDNNENIYKIYVKRYSTKQIDRILDEFYIRTGIKAVNYTNDVKTTRNNKDEFNNFE